MESFIVRIYRRDPAKPGKLAGVVEEVGVKRKKPFHNRKQLWAILANPKADDVDDGGTTAARE